INGVSTKGTFAGGVHTEKHVRGGVAWSGGGEHTVEVDFAVFVVVTVEDKIVQIVWCERARIELLANPDIGCSPGCPHNCSRRAARAESPLAGAPGRIIEIRSVPIQRTGAAVRVPFPVAA